MPNLRLLWACFLYTDLIDILIYFTRHTPYSLHGLTSDSLLDFWSIGTQLRKIDFPLSNSRDQGGFHLHFLVFPLVYQSNSRIGVLVNSSFANQKDFNNISASFQNLFVVVFTRKRTHLFCSTEMRWLFISSTDIWVTGSDTGSFGYRAMTELTTMWSVNDGLFGNLWFPDYFTRKKNEKKSVLKKNSATCETTPASFWRFPAGFRIIHH